MLTLSGAPLASVQKTVAELTAERDVVKSWAADDSWNELAVKIARLGEKFGPQMEKIGAAGGPLAEQMFDLVNAAPNVPDVFDKQDWRRALIKTLLEAQKQLDDSTDKLQTSSKKLPQRQRAQGQDRQSYRADS